MLYLHVICLATARVATRFPLDIDHLLEGGLIPLCFKLFLIFPPFCAIPDFKVIAHTRHSNLIFQSSVGTQLGRNNQPSLAIKLYLARAWVDAPFKVAQFID